MDPARTFKESLTSRPELENSQGQTATSAGDGTNSALPNKGQRVGRTRDSVIRCNNVVRRCPSEPEA